MSHGGQILIRLHFDKDATKEMFSKHYCSQIIVQGNNLLIIPVAGYSKMKRACDNYGLPLNKNLVDVEGDKSKISFINCSCDMFKFFPKPTKGWVHKSGYGYIIDTINSTDSVGEVIIEHDVLYTDNEVKVIGLEFNTPASLKHFNSVVAGGGTTRGSIELFSINNQPFARFNQSSNTPNAIVSPIWSKQTNTVRADFSVVNLMRVGMAGGFRYIIEATKDDDIWFLRAWSQIMERGHVKKIDLPSITFSSKLK